MINNSELSINVVDYKLTIDQNVEMNNYDTMKVAENEELKNWKTELKIPDKLDDYKLKFLEIAFGITIHVARTFRLN